MRLTELYEYLGSIIKIVTRHEDPTVHVISNNYGPQVGGRRTVSVTRISQGIDWEHGKMLIHTDPPVYDGVEEMQAAANFAYQVRDIMWTLSQDPSRNRNGNAIRMLKEELDTWLPDRMERDKPVANSNEDSSGGAGGCSAI